MTPSTTVALDYAKELRKALAARKLRYRFLAIGNATDAELPSGDPPNMDIRLTIRDGLLVRIDKKIKIRRVRTGLCAPRQKGGTFATVKTNHAPMANRMPVRRIVW